MERPGSRRDFRGASYAYGCDYLTYGFVAFSCPMVVDMS